MAFRLASGKTGYSGSVDEHSHPPHTPRTTTWWRKLLHRCTNLAHDCKAVSATEYAVMLALIILVAAGSIQLIGSKFLNLYTLIANSVGDTV